MERLLSVASQIELRKIREDNLSAEERKKLAETKADLDLCRFTIGDMIAPSLSEVIGLIEKIHNEGKAEVVIFDKFANLKYKYGNREFWCRGYYVDTVGRNKAAIEKYIRNQLTEDKNEKQLVMKELFDPFTGEPAKKDK